MKITLYHPDGSIEVYTDCSTLITVAPELGFVGKDWRNVQVKVLTTVPYTITEEMEPVEQAKAAAAELRASIKGACGACKG